MAVASKQCVMVSWASVNHGAAPLVTALRSLAGNARVTRLYLCSRQASGPDGLREREAVKTTVQGLKEALKEACPDVVHLDWKTQASPTDHGAIRPFAEEALRRARDENPLAKVIIHLSPGTPAMHAVWLLLGSTGFIPGDVELVQTSDTRGQAAGAPPVRAVHLELDTWLKRFQAATPSRSGDQDEGHLWDPARVKSKPLQDALSMLKEWAPMRVPVLLMGERGTGKTTLANVLRSMSPFQKLKTGQWPTVVCGQFRVNPQLARSDLFGHARGAFTGATGDRSGILEQADGDTVFLDEIADIDRDTQRLLMAALEGRGFQRLGESKVRKSAFRIVAATNRTMEDLKSNHLDQDFLDRLAIFVLGVPPLRACKEDLPDAWRSVLGAASRDAGSQVSDWAEFTTHRGLLAAIQSHPLPGNFRDLQRAAYHLLAALGAGRPLKRVVESAIHGLGAADSGASAVLTGQGAGVRPSREPLRIAMLRYEGRLLEGAMSEASGNKSEAARLLGIPRKTMENRLRLVHGNL